jgi:signal transduction histidine kinase
VFEPFRRGDDTVDGLGLGLTIARQLIRMHGGNLEVDSAGRGTGTTFTAVLPLHAHE